MVVRGGETARRLLGDTSAEAGYMRGAGIVVLPDNASTSQVLEEVFHFIQDQRGDYSDLDDDELVLRREIDAQNYLLSVAERHKIPLEETELTKKNLADYEDDLRRWLYDHGRGEG